MKTSLINVFTSVRAVRQESTEQKAFHVWKAMYATG